MPAPKKPPPSKLEVPPGESVWAALARELARNPEGPVGLHVQSAMGRVLAPRWQAVEQVLEALGAQIAQEGESQRAAVAAAIAYWERETGAPMDAELLEELRQEARKSAERRTRQPPAMQNILHAMPAVTDVGYELGVHLHGLQGTWHRLWASMCLCYSFGDDPSTESMVRTVRAQFEQLLGRPLEPQEFDALAARARKHYETVMRPRLGGAEGLGNA
jgi:hypothetical protein